MKLNGKFEEKKTNNPADHNCSNERGHCENLCEICVYMKKNMNNPVPVPIFK